MDTFLRDRNVRRSSCRWWKMRPRVEREENSGSNYTNNDDIKPRCFFKRREVDLRKVTHDRHSRPFDYARLTLRVLPKRVTSGPVITVVTRAIITSMVKIR